MEGICQATGVTGWFAAYPSRHPDHDENHGVGGENGDFHPDMFDDGHWNIFRHLPTEEPNEEHFGLCDLDNVNRLCHRAAK